MGLQVAEWMTVSEALSRKSMVDLGGWSRSLLLGEIECMRDLYWKYGKPIVDRVHGSRPADKRRQHPAKMSTETSQQLARERTWRFNKNFKNAV
jgi:hypothetical protein